MQPESCLRLVGALGMAAAIAFLSGVLRPAPAFADPGCGSGTECYSVPDGCGVGVGCQRVWCDDEICPALDRPPNEHCFFCEHST